LKKIALRLIAVILVAILIVSLLAGCRRAPQSNFEPPEFVFVPESIPLPDDFANITNLTYADGIVYFSSIIVIDEEKWETETKLFSMSIDGTNITELVNYRPGNIVHTYDDVLGNVGIMSLAVDDAGNLWIAESGNFYRLDVPDDFVGEEHEKWNYYQDLGSVMTVRKLDKTGAELLSVDLSTLSGTNNNFYIAAFNIDSANNIYVGSDTNIFVLGSEGNLLFKLDVTNWVDSLVRMPDGSVAFFGWVDNNRVLRKIDAAGQRWGEIIELPYNVYQIHQGGGDYLIVYHDNLNLYGIDSETGESVKLLNWIDSGVVNNGLENVSLLPDGRVMCTNQDWDRRTGEQSFELIILTRIPYADLPERTVLSLATLWLDWDLRSYIVQFNETNPNYRIHVIDYSEFNTEDDWQAGLTRLSAEIISGNVPDMLDVSNLPFKQYVARGLLEDLYPFIDSDPELNRTDFIESIFRAAEMEGGLYRVFPSFSINTLIGHPSVVGLNMGWNMDEFRAVLDANPQADMPMGRWLTKESFLQNAVMLGMDEYVDWAAGEARFDRGDFAQLLEFANRFPAEIDYDDDMYIDDHELIATGRQIMAQMYVSDFRGLQMQRAMFGGDIVFKGFPTESRSGNSLNIGSGLAVTTTCIDKAGAWTFLRTILTNDWQKENVQWNFPTNKVAFDEKAKEAMTMDENSDTQIGWGRDMMITLTAMTQEELNQIMALIDSVSGIASYDEALMNIINEGAADFFSGRSSAQDAARIIQSRTSIYISEQS